jgi:hypothetical protein
LKVEPSRILAIQTVVVRAFDPTREEELGVRLVSDDSQTKSQSCVATITRSPAGAVGRSQPSRPRTYMIPFPKNRVRCEGYVKLGAPVRRKAFG